jgi:hypothetical protein
MSTQPRGKKRKERGSILLLAFFFLIVLFALAVAFFRIIPAEYHSASQARRGVQAHFAGDAGIRKGVAWLTAQPSHFIPNSDIEAFNAANFVDGDTLPRDNAILVQNQVDENWSFTSRINLDESDFFRRIYVIETFAYFNGRKTRMTKSTVQNESFAKYALLYDIWNEGLFFGLTPNGIQGPMHTNGFPRLSTANDAYFEGTFDPWISGPLASLTHSASYSAGSDDRGDGLQYMLGNVTLEGTPTTAGNAARLPYTPATGAPISNRYDKIIEGGREKIRQIQNIELPEENTDLRAKAWGDTVPDPAGMAALRASKGPLLVNTSSGIPNDPAGVVSGGIFISGSDASEVRLDITPEGHQKTTVRQGDTTLPSAPSVQYFDEIPIYRRLYQPPDEPWETTECVRTQTRIEDVTERVRRTRMVDPPRADAGRCGTRLEYITGEGGLTTSITVPNVCSWEEVYFENVVVGTREIVECVERRVVDSGVRTPDPYYIDVPADDPDREPTPYRTENRNITTDYLADPTAFPNAVEVQTPRTRAIPNWNSVVEVNDDVYRIPFHAGMKINGEEITNASDPRLTVADGNTVTIRNDYQDGAGNYREYTVMEGRINGITFSDVNLYGVRGTNKGSKYADELGNVKYQGRVIATNLGEGKNLEIRDGILQYYNGPDAALNDGRNRLKSGETSPNADHILGIIANKVDIRPTGRSNAYENSDNMTGGARETYFNGGHFRGGINVFAVIMAGKDGGIGGFGAHDRAMDSDDGLGDFNLFGGIISSVARRTQRGHSGGFTTGFRLGLNYDPIAAEFLENFPTTNVYSVLRYVSVSTDSTMTEGFSGGVKAF